MHVARRTRMGRFWDARAREDALYFINNTLDYGDPDEERFWASGPHDLDALLELLGTRIEAADSIVEIGCGVGRMTRCLAERGADVRALDISAEMLTRARSYNPGLDNVRWIRGDGASLAPIEAGSADVCLSYVVFQHIPDPEITLGYIREIGRVLRPGGWAGFQVSDAPAIHRRRSLAPRIAARIASLRGAAPRGQSHAAWLGSAVDLDRLLAVAAESGLERERISGAGTQFCIVGLRKREREPA